MKIEKYGTVTITVDEVKVSGFEFDGEGKQFGDERDAYRSGAVLVANWAITRLRYERDELLEGKRVEDDGGNTVAS